MLPAVSSLKALRELAKDSHASEPYVGFGNPLLDGERTKYPDDAERANIFLGVNQSSSSSRMTMVTWCAECIGGPTGINRPSLRPRLTFVNLHCAQRSANRAVLAVGAPHKNAS